MHSLAGQGGGPVGAEIMNTMSARAEAEPDDRLPLTDDTETRRHLTAAAAIATLPPRHRLLSYREPPRGAGWSPGPRGQVSATLLGSASHCLPSWAPGRLAAPLHLCGNKMSASPKRATATFRRGAGPFRREREGEEERGRKGRKEKGREEGRK